MSTETIALISFEVTNLNYQTYSLNKAADSPNYQLNVDANVLEADEMPVGLNINATVSCEEIGFDIILTANAIFAIPDDVSAEEASEYLQGVGTTRVMDRIRAYLVTLSAMSGMPSLEIPPMVFSGNEATIIAQA